MTQNYLDLFPGYTRGKARFMALAQAVLQQAVDLMALVPMTESGFSFGSAEGVQLDALGESVSIMRQERWDDETYRSILLKKLQLYTWDGTNETVSRYLDAGQSQHDNTDGSITVQAGSSLPLPANELFPAPIGVRTCLSC